MTLLLNTHFSRYCQSAAAQGPPEKFCALVFHGGTISISVFMSIAAAYRMLRISFYRVHLMG